MKNETTTEITTEGTEMGNNSGGRLQVLIRRDGKPDVPGLLTVNGAGHIRVVSSGFMNRIVLDGRAESLRITIDQANCSLKVNQHTFGLQATDVNRAEMLLNRYVAATPSKGLSVTTESHSTSVSLESLDSLAGWSTALTFFSLCLGLLGVLGGIFLALQTDGGSDRPYVAAGIAVALNAWFFAMVGVVLGKIGDVIAQAQMSLLRSPQGTDG